MSQLSAEAIAQMADRVEQAEATVTAMTKMTIDFPELDMINAYDVQEEVIRRKQANGDTVIGWKLGLTSLAKQRMMNVFEPTYGVLTSSMYVGTEAVDTSKLIHPKAEPEIAFIMKQDVSGAHVTTADILRATERVFPAIEIIDSRYENFNFTLPDVVADNSSSSRFLMGGQGRSPEGLSLETLGMILRKNGELMLTGAGASVLGHPASAIAWLVKKLHTRNQYVKKGDIILCGAMSEALAVVPGDTIVAQFEDIGDIHVKFS